MKKLKKVLPGRDGIWQVLRHYKNIKTLTLEDINKHVRQNEHTIRMCLNQLISGGFVSLTVIDRFNHYQLIKDVGINRPILTNSGKAKPVTNYQKIWCAIKVLKRFDARDVSHSTQVKEGCVKVYLRYLKFAKYIAVIKKATHTTPESYLFKASNDTGFKAPQLKKDKSIYDQNLRRIVYTHVRGAS